MLGRRRRRGGKRTRLQDAAQPFGERNFSIIFAARHLGAGCEYYDFSQPAAGLMNGLHFNLTVISRRGAIGSLVTLPLPLALGWLTDRVARKPILLGLLPGPAARAAGPGCGYSRHGSSG